MKPRVGFLLNTAAVAAAVVAAATGFFYLHAKAQRGVNPDGRVRIVSDWRDYVDGGARVGPQSANVHVTFFLDYTCQHCSDALATMEHILDTHPNEVAMVIRHFTLSDGVARDADIAAECSRQAGALVTFSRSVFEQPDWTDGESWGCVLRVARKAVDD